MYNQIIFLTKELEKVKSELEIVKRTQGVKKNKVSIISWLNNHYKPDFTIQEMIKSIKVTRDDLQSLQDKKTRVIYVEIINRFITENFDKKLPLCSFPQSSEQVYVHTNHKDVMIGVRDSDSKMIWTNICEIFIQSIISKIQSDMLHELKNWETEMGDKIYSDEDVSEEYSTYISAIIGKSNKDILHEISRFMKPRLYQILKRKNIDMEVTEIVN